MSHRVGLASAADVRDPLRRVLVINTVLCVLAFVPAFGVQLASVMSGASPGSGALGTFVAVLGFLLPAMPVVSVVGSWSTRRWRRVALAFVALPWLYAVLLAITLLVFFRPAPS